jgi:dCMP deaminase
MITDNQDLKIALGRRDKNEYYLSVAKTIAFGSKCPEGKQHGAIAVKNKRMISTGYNGPAAGMPHCGVDCPLEVYKAANGGKKNYALCPAVHAEINAVVTAAQIGIALVNSMIYVTKEPCPDCLKALRNLHIAGVVFPNDDEDDDGTHFILLGPEMTQRIELEY